MQPRIFRCIAAAAKVQDAKLMRPWRPRLEDVERLSRGDAAKVRGTGSRQIPHRLNAEERELYDAAKKKVCAYAHA